MKLRKKEDKRRAIFSLFEFWKCSKAAADGFADESLTVMASVTINQIVPTALESIKAANARLKLSDQAKSGKTHFRHQNKSRLRMYILEVF